MSAHAARIFVFGLVRPDLVAHHALAGSAAHNLRGILRFAGFDFRAAVLASGNRGLVQATVTGAKMVAATIN